MNGTAPTDPTPATETTTFRLDAVAHDRHRVREIVESTGFFSPEEVDISGQLVDERLSKGPASGYEFVFAEIDGQPVGFACFGRIPATQQSFDLYWIAVRRDRQRRGVGRVLLDKTELLIHGTAAPESTSTHPAANSTPRPGPSTKRWDTDKRPFCRNFFAPGDDKVIFVKVPPSRKTRPPESCRIRAARDASGTVVLARVDGRASARVRQAPGRCSGIEQRGQSCELCLRKNYSARGGLRLRIIGGLPPSDLAMATIDRVSPEFLLPPYSSGTRFATRRRSLASEKARCVRVLRERLPPMRLTFANKVSLSVGWRDRVGGAQQRGSTAVILARQRPHGANGRRKTCRPFGRPRNWRSLCWSSGASSLRTCSTAAIASGS